MLYKRSSFLKWLKEKCDCELIPVTETVMTIKHGPASASMYMTKGDKIDYEEIYVFYKKLYLPMLPGDSDLIRID
jgi:hypothetical protein